MMPSFSISTNMIGVVRRVPAEILNRCLSWSVYGWNLNRMSLNAVCPGRRNVWGEYRDHPNEYQGLMLDATIVFCIFTAPFLVIHKVEVDHGESA